METFLTGLSIILIGGLLTFFGYQFFRILIPVFGFLAGFSWGAQALAVGLGTGFLATATGWVVGLVVGLVVAALAYFFYEAAVAILAAAIGYWLTIGLFGAIGIQPGFLVMFFAWAAAIAFAIGAIYYKAPKGLLVVLTAFAGATTVIGGFLVMFGTVPVWAFGTDLVSRIISQSFLWVVAWISLAVVGSLTQVSLARDIEEVTSYPSMEPGDTGSTSLAGAKGGTVKKTTTTKEVEVEETD